MAEIAEPKHDTEATDENVHLVNETSPSDSLLVLSALATLKVHRILLERCCSMDY